MKLDMTVENRKTTGRRYLSVLAATSALVTLSLSQAFAYDAGGADDGSDILPSGDAEYNTAIGQSYTHTWSIYSTAVGGGAKVGIESDGGTSLGFDATIDNNAIYSTAIGIRSYVSSGSPYATTLGSFSWIGENSDGATVLGTWASVGNNSSAAVAIGAGAEVLENSSGAMAIGVNSVAGHANSVALGAGSATIVGAEENYKAYGLDELQNSFGSVSVGSAEGETRTITGVAAGTRDNDAVNVEQLRSVDEKLTESIDGVDKFSVKYDASEKDPSVPDYTSITLGVGAVGDAPVLINNVSAGEISSTSLEAVNGAQIHAISSRIADAFGGGSAVNPDGTISMPTYSIRGTSYTDVGSAFSAVDNQLASLQGDIGETRKEARRAAAVGLAAASLRYDDRPGKFSVSASGAVWKSEGAFAFGAGYTSENQRFRGSVNAVTSGGDWGVGAGLGFSLN